MRTTANADSSDTIFILIRNDHEFARVQRYIESNPVKAGLVGILEEFRWSAMTRGQSPAAATKG